MSNRNHRFSARFAALAATTAVVASGLAATGASAQAPGDDQRMRALEYQEQLRAQEAFLQFMKSATRI
jgi:hypothetical protein